MIILFINIAEWGEERKMVREEFKKDKQSTENHKPNNILKGHIDIKKYTC
jgi:hypothetical protein